ncbi:MAG: YoaK family protein [Polyangiaceae bacterium]
MDGKARNAVVDEESETANSPVCASSQTRLRASDIAREAEIAGIVFTDDKISGTFLSGNVGDADAQGDPEANLIAEHHSDLAEIDLPGAPLPANSANERRLESVRPEAAAFESVRPRSAALEDAHLVVSTLFGAIAGYVDTVSFLALFGMFTAHITGDLVVSLAELPQGSVATRVTMLPIFMISVAVTTVFARATRRYDQAPLFPLLALMTASLLVFGATGIILQPFMTSQNNWAVSIVGATGVGAMAVQNMIMRDALKSWTPTTIMTGNLTQVTIQLVELAFATRERDGETRDRIRKKAVARLVKFGLPLIGFVAGAASGAAMARLYGFWSVALPASVVGALTVWHWRHGHR